MAPDVYCVSTRIGGGRGGISSVLSNLQQSSSFKQANLSYVESHAGGSRLLPYLKALVFVWKHAHKDSVYWFHCGPWLSTSRKTSLAILAKIRGAKVVFHIHSVTFAAAIRHPFGRMLLAPVFGLADGIIVLTPWWASLLQRHFPKAGPKVLVSPNPVHPDWLRLAKESVIDGDVAQRPFVRILAASRLLPGKGFDVVIAAMNLLPDTYRLVIAGEGPENARLAGLIRGMKLDDRVEMVGWVDGDVKTRLFLTSDVFCLPSRHDSFGMVFVEAMAAGLPIVAGNVGAIPDVVPDGIAGLLVDVTAENVAHAIVECAGRKVEMGAEGRAHVVKNFDPDAVGARLLKFLVSLPDTAEER